MTRTFRITLSGCDDSTTVMMELSPKMEAFLQHLAALVNATSTYSCMPRLLIERVLSSEEPQ